MRPKELIIDVRTRWNSTHDMIKCALELRGPLDNITIADPDLGAYKLTAEEWQLLEDVLQYFAVFKVVSDNLCATSHPTLATAVPAYNLLMDSLEDYRDAPSTPGAIKEAADAAIDKLKTYYTGAGAEIYPVGTILDPRLKLDYYRENDWEEEWIQEARTTFDHVFARYHVPSAPAVRESVPVKLSEGADMMTLVCKRRCVAVRSEVSEVKAYLNAPPAALNADVLAWWKASAAMYPCLAAMARDYLAIPATSAPVERVFSGGTDLVRPKRGSLHEDAIQACLCLKSWLKHLRGD
jgi:hypothetical protein